VDFHTNILRFYGISKLRTGLIHQMNKYLLIMEYADGGTLHSYLMGHFHKLDWNDKFRLAIQLANAISCIHNEDIVHGDLVIFYKYFLNFFLKIFFFFFFF
jgi:serine/threonine protein kinase